MKSIKEYRNVLQSAFNITMKCLLVTVLLATAAFANPSARIAGGTDAALGEVASMAGILNKDGVLVCGGTIIGTNLVVTAATCVNGTDPKDVSVVAGKVDLTAAGGSLSTVAEIIVNPGFAISLEGVPMNDIALVKVTTDFPRDETHGVAFTPPVDDVLPAGQELWVTGWGAPSYGGVNVNILQIANVVTINIVTCTNAYASSTPIQPNQMCAVGNSKGICSGDTGGPLIDKTSGIVWGVTSWSRGCADNSFPGVFTEISKYVTWINMNRP